MRNYLLTISVLLLVCSAPLKAQDYSKMSRFVRERVHRHLSSSPLPHSASAAKGIAGSRDGDTSHSNSGTDNGKTSTDGGNGGTAGKLMVFVEGPEDAVRPWCLSHADGIHIALVPLDSLASLSEDIRVTRIEASKRRMQALNDLSLQKTGADKLQQGISPLQQAFDGEGILIGVQDVSFDIGHPTFRSKKDGRLRIVRMWDMLDNEPYQEYNDALEFPIGRLYSTPETLEAKDHSYDAYLHYHGTHVAGIAAGNGCDTPYTGMAPEADIYLTSTIINSNDSLLPPRQDEAITDAIYMLAFQNMFHYADSVSMPCVANFSIGGSYDIAYNDPLMERYAAAITGPGKVIVASAGNDADKRYYLTKPAERDTVGGLFIPDSKSTTLALHISGTRYMRLKITDVKKTSGNNSMVWALGFIGGGIYRQGELVYSLKWNDWHEEVSSGELGKGAKIEIFSGPDGYNPERVGYDIYITPPDESFKKHSYVIEIIGAGAEAYAFVQEGILSAYHSTTFNLDGAEIAANINSPATLPSVIAVGSTSWRTSFTNYKGRNMNVTAGKDGLLSSFSSIGPSVSGRIKPDFCAPGQALISSLNSRFERDRSPSLDSYIVNLNGTHSDYTGRDYGWLALSGTSMACPVAAGIIALWMQADPSLTKDRIMDIIAKTSRQPDATLSYPNNYYGYGEIDAYHGMLEILGLTGISNISTTPLTTATVRPDGSGNIIISLDSAHKGSAADIVTVYDTTGRIVRRTAITTTDRLTNTTTTDTPADITIPAQDLHGIFVVQIGQQGSTIIRL